LLIEFFAVSCFVFMTFDTIVKLRLSYCSLDCSATY